MDQENVKTGNERKQRKGGTSRRRPVSCAQEIMLANKRGSSSNRGKLNRPKDKLLGSLTDKNKETKETNKMTDISSVSTQIGRSKIDVIGGERVIIAEISAIAEESDTPKVEPDDPGHAPANTGSNTQKETTLDVKSLMEKLEEISSGQQQEAADASGNTSKETVWMFRKEEESNIRLEDTEWPPLTKPEVVEGATQFSTKSDFGTINGSLDERDATKYIFGYSRNRKDELSFEIHIQQPQNESSQTQQSLQNNGTEKPPTSNLEESKELGQRSDLDIRPSNNQKTDLSPLFTPQLSCSLWQNPPFPDSNQVNVCSHHENNRNIQQHASKATKEGESQMDELEKLKTFPSYCGHELKLTEQKQAPNKVEQDHQYVRVFVEGVDYHQKNPFQGGLANTVAKNAPEEVRERLQQQLEEKQKEVQIQQRKQRQNKSRHDGSRRGSTDRQQLSYYKPNNQQGRPSHANQNSFKPPESRFHTANSLTLGLQRRNSDDSHYSLEGSSRNVEDSRQSSQCHPIRDTRYTTRSAKTYNVGPSAPVTRSNSLNREPIDMVTQLTHASFSQPRRPSASELKTGNHDSPLTYMDTNEIPDGGKLKKSGDGIWINQGKFSNGEKDVMSSPIGHWETPSTDTKVASNETHTASAKGQRSCLSSIPLTRNDAKAGSQHTTLHREQKHDEKLPEKFIFGRETFKTRQQWLQPQSDSNNGNKTYQALTNTNMDLAPDFGPHQKMQRLPCGAINNNSFKDKETREVQDGTNLSGSLKRPSHTRDIWSLPKCSSCHDDFHWPHLLNCFHSFCFQCLTHLYDNIKSEIKCPMCSWSTTVGMKGPFDLTLDLDLCSKLYRSTNPFLCTLCSGPRNGTVYCVTCMHFLCNECRYKHTKARSTALHSFEKVVNIRWIHGKLTEMCSSHPNNAVDRFCQDCLETICFTCERYGGGHLYHTVVREVEQSRKKIQTMTSEVDRMRDHVRKQMQPMILKKQEIENKARACKRNIHLFSNNVIEITTKKRAEARALLDTAYDEVTDGMKKLDDLTTQFSNDYKAFKEFMDRYLKDPTPSSILPVATKIIQRYNDLLQRYEEIEKLEGFLTVELLFSPEFPVVNDSINQSYHIETFESLSELMNMDSEMSRILRENTEAMLLKNSYDINSQIKDELSGRENGRFFSSEPSAKAADDIYGDFDYNFSRQPTLSIHSFGDQGKGEYTFGEPSGIVYLFDGSLAVCDTANHRIVLYNEDRVYQRTIGQPPIMANSHGEKNKTDRHVPRTHGYLYYPYRLAQCPLSNNLVVIERPPSRAIQIFDLDGKFINRFGNDVLQHPRGVAVDENGVIVVVEGKTMKLMLFTQSGSVVQIFHLCIHLEFPNDIAAKNGNIYISDNRGHCVHIFDYEGQFRGTIGNESVTYYPIGVSVNFMDNIIVTDNHNTFNISVFNKEGTYLYGYKSRVKHANCYNVAVHPSRYELVVTSRDCLVIIFDYSPIAPTDT